MSLLNQVLQDLDNRSQQGAPRPVYLAAASGAGAQALPPGRRVAPDWLRLAVWAAVGSAAMIWAWLFLAADREGAASRVLPLPQPATDGTSSQVLAADIRTAPKTPPSPSPAAQGSAPPEQSHPVSAVASPAPVTQTPWAIDRAAQAEDVAHPAQPEVVVPAPGFLPLRNAVVPQARVAPAVDETAAPSPVPRVKTAAPAPRSALAAARQAIAQGELAEAEALLQQRLGETPDDLKARELLIGLMLRGERHDAALKQLDQALGQHPGHLKFILIKARLLVQEGDSAAAIRFLEGAPSAARGEVALRQMLGALYQQQGRYQDAVQSYRVLLALTPRAGAAWAGLAISLDALGDTEALETYRRALQVGGLPQPAAAYARQRIAQLEAADG